MPYHPLPRVLQPDTESLEPTEDELRDESLEELLAEPPKAIGLTPPFRVVLVLGIFLLFVGLGLITGHLWQRVTSHEERLSEQQAELQQMARKQATVTGEEGPIQKLGERLSVVMRFINGQSKQMAELQTGQAKIQSQVQTGLTRLQKQVDDLKRGARTMTSVPKAEQTAGVSGCFPWAGLPSPPIITASSDKG
jgi:hypothetical protein